MRILFVCQTYPTIGGLERVLTTLANTLDQRGHQLAIASWHSDGEDFPFPLNDGIPCMQLPDSRRAESPANISFLTDYMTASGTDLAVYHNNSAPVMRLCAAVRQASGKPLAVVLHREILAIPGKANIRSWKGLIKRLLRPVYLRYLRRSEIARRQFEYDHADAYVVLSAQYLDPFRSIIRPGDGGARLHSIHNPIDPAPAAAAPAVRQPELLYVGRLCENEKRVGRLLDIWEKIYAAHPDWTLRIVGDGEAIETLRHRSQQLARVEFEGFQNDPQPFYARASICCLVSDHEGLPMTLLEASQAGTIPIAFHSFSSAPEIIPAELLVTPFDLEQYAQVLSRLMSDPGARERLSAWSAANARKFSVDTIADQWEDLLNDLVKHHLSCQKSGI